MTRIHKEEDIPLIWTVPRMAVLTSGQGEGNTPLNAFDNALLDAGIGNLNLVKVSSVLPPGARVHHLTELRSKLCLRAGQILPAVYAALSEDEPGTVISAAIAVVRPCSNQLNGMIFEAWGVVSEDSVRRQAEEMAIESMKMRQYEWSKISVCSASMCVGNKVGCVVAAVLLHAMEAL